MLEVKLKYPYSDKFIYETRLERINLDKERENDLLNNKGFIVSVPHNIKKDIKDPNSIFSTRFGQTVKDIEPFADRYKCKCGKTKHVLKNGTKCPYCGELVQFVDDDYSYFGWIKLIPHPIIHPNLYKSISAFLGNEKAKRGESPKSRLENILKVEDKKDRDGFSQKQDDPPKDQPFFGKGMTYFKEHFDEIMLFYKDFAGGKKDDAYVDIMLQKQNVFTYSIPVYTTHLRPFDLDGSSFFHEKTNELYNMMAKLGYYINNNDLSMNKKKKPKNMLLYDIQMKYMKLYDEVLKILSGKKGQFRALANGRYTFTARDVIVSDMSLRIDQIKLPYAALIVLLEQQIINILSTIYSINLTEARSIWEDAVLEENEVVRNIIESLLKNGNINVIINRNPTIGHGGILFMNVVGISKGYTMAVSLQILKSLCADFDGDCLNIWRCVNKAFEERAKEIFNPRNAFYISKNDGMFNEAVNHSRDMIININSLTRICRKAYSQEQLDKLKYLRRKRDEYVYGK